MMKLHHSGSKEAMRCNARWIVRKCRKVVAEIAEPGEQAKERGCRLPRAAAAGQQDPGITGGNHPGMNELHTAIAEPDGQQAVQRARAFVQEEAARAGIVADHPVLK